MTVSVFLVAKVTVVLHRFIVSWGSSCRLTSSQSYTSGKPGDVVEAVTQRVLGAGGTRGDYRRTYFKEEKVVRLWTGSHRLAPTG